MASKLDQGDGSAISDINVTPFVDVVLVLLVIFMVTAPQLMKEAMDIQLPKASSGSATAMKTLGVAVNKQGQILLNGQPLTPELLQEEVTRALKEDPEVQAVITADADARHGDVVKAIDLVKSAGLKRFAIQIERSE